MNRKDFLDNREPKTNLINVQSIIMAELEKQQVNLIDTPANRKIVENIINQTIAILAAKEKMIEINDLVKINEITPIPFNTEPFDIFTYGRQQELQRQYITTDTNSPTVSNYEAETTFLPVLPSSLFRYIYNES